MKCPFLQEAHVKYCQASPFKKMIVQSSEPSSTERCASRAYAQCPAARQEHVTLPEAEHCPFLQMSLMQYCSAASVTKYIPYTESVLSRCGSENHRYCELFLAIAEPETAPAEPGPDGGDGIDGERFVDGVAVSTKLAYAPNHMWLDVSEDGACHIGVDGFFAKILGRIDKLTFIAPKGTGRPCVVISTCGADLPMIFPVPMTVTRTNDYLRANPDRLISHPYSLGWLFEGNVSAPNQTRTALVRGKAALDWMRSEVERISVLIHNRYAVAEAAGPNLVMDGGAVRPGFVQHLEPEEVLGLFNEFFAF